MIMRRLGYSLLLLALGVGGAVPTADTTLAQRRAAGAAAAGFIAGAAVGAAISGSRHSPQVIVPDYGPRRPGGGGWGASYSPRAGFTCYPRQQACYRPNGAYAPNLTWTEFRR
jgi:hypothetical protein